MNADRPWCDGCRREFPLKRLKCCGACRIPTYCSVTCQAVSWKNGHKKICREIVVEGDLLKGWAQSWDHFLIWATVRVLDLTNKPENYHNHCFEIQLRKTGSNDLRRAYEVLGGRVKPLNVDEEVIFESDSDVDEERPNNRIYAALLVMGEEGELTDATGLCWELTKLTRDAPEVSEEWAKHCVDVVKWVVAYSKPRRAFRDAAAVMEILRRREFELGSVGVIRP